MEDITKKKKHPLAGNQFWKMRSSHGPKPKFKNGEQLKAACEEYFEWVSDANLFEDKVNFYEGVAVHEPAAKMHAMTISGLCIFLDVSTAIWAEWRKNREDLLDVIRWAEDIIRHQKFVGAAAGLLNANIIARDLGLKDAQDHSSTDGTMTPKNGISIVELPKKDE